MNLELHYTDVTANVPNTPKKHKCITMDMSDCMLQVHISSRDHPYLIQFLEQFPVHESGDNHQCDDQNGNDKSKI